MTIKRWYLIMLLLPLLPPAVLLLISQLFDYEAIMQGLGTVAKLIIISFIIAGIPYLIFAVGVFFWLRHKSIARIKKLSWFLPWILMLLCGLFCFMLYSVMYPNGDTLMLSLIFMGLSVPVSFFYVALVHVLTRLACHANP